MLRILLVDDHPLVIFASQAVLEKAGFEVVGDSRNGAEAIKLARQLQPDLVILDIGLPKIDGFRVMTHLLAQKKPPKILVSTSHTAAHFAKRCRQAGANGFVTKTEQLSHLIEAVKVVSNGYNYFPQSETLPERADSNYVGQPDAEIISGLSNREMSVLVGLANGFSNKDISIQLVLSEKTISTYKHRLKMKLNARSIIDLTDFARRNQLLE